MAFYKVKEQLKIKEIFNRYNGIRAKLLIVKKYDKKKLFKKIIYINK